MKRTPSGQIDPSNEHEETMRMREDDAVIRGLKPVTQRPIQPMPSDEAITRGTDWRVLAGRREGEKMVVLCTREHKDERGGVEFVTWRVDGEGNRYWGHYSGYDRRATGEQIEEIKEHAWDDFRTR